MLSRAFQDPPTTALMIDKAIKQSISLTPEQHFECLLDTYAAPNTDYDEFHLRLSSRFPQCLAVPIHYNDRFHRPLLTEHPQHAWTPYCRDPLLQSQQWLHTVRPCQESQSSSLVPRTRRATTYSSVYYDIISRARISHCLPPDISFDLEHFRRTSQ
jgi:hypothetical protein